MNPKLKVVDYQKVLHSEGCESVRGFAALVPRFREVEISGNHFGKKSLLFSSARLQPLPGVEGRYMGGHSLCHSS